MYILHYFATFDNSSKLLSLQRTYDVYHDPSKTKTKQLGSIFLLNLQCLEMQALYFFVSKAKCIEQRTTCNKPDLQRSVDADQRIGSNNVVVTDKLYKIMEYRSYFKPNNIKLVIFKDLEGMCAVLSSFMKEFFQL